MNSLSRTAKMVVMVVLGIVAIIVIWKILLWALGFAIKLLIVAAIAGGVLYVISAMTGWKPLGSGSRKSLP